MAAARVSAPRSLQVLSVMPRWTILLYSAAEVATLVQLGAVRAAFARRRVPHTVVDRCAHAHMHTLLLAVVNGVVCCMSVRVSKCYCFARYAARVR